MGRKKMEAWNNIRGMIKKDFPYIVCILILLFLLLLVISNQQEQQNQCNNHWMEEFESKCSNSWNINYEEIQNVVERKEEETKTIEIQTGG